jgi:hypothetical protein
MGDDRHPADIHGHLLLFGIDHPFPYGLLCQMSMSADDAEEKQIQSG